MDILNVFILFLIFLFAPLLTGKILKGRGYGLYVSLIILGLIMLIGIVLVNQRIGCPHSDEEKLIMQSIKESILPVILGVFFYIVVVVFPAVNGIFMELGYLPFIGGFIKSMSDGLFVGTAGTIGYVISQQFINTCK
jgi:hypothetical protein